MTRPPAELHAAAVEGAALVLVREHECAPSWDEEHKQRQIAAVVERPHYFDPWKGEADRIIRAYLAVLAKAGWKVVPQNPPPEMQGAGYLANLQTPGNTVEGYRDIWRHMWWAAPAWPPVNRDSD